MSSPAIIAVVTIPAIPRIVPITGTSDGESSADPKKITARTDTVPIILPSVLMSAPFHRGIRAARLFPPDHPPVDRRRAGAVLHNVPDHLASMFCGGLSAVSYATRKRSLMLQFRALAMLTILSIFGMLFPVFQSEKTDW